VKARLFSWWEAVRSSYLFTPLALVFAALLLAIASLWVDSLLANGDSVMLGFLPEIGVEGSRLVLSTIAASMMTVTSIVFSITVVTLTLASGQLGPRLLHNFRSDPANQFVLGVFLALFVYCLTVLQRIRGGFGDAQFVPHLSIAIALGLTLVGIGTLIFFIHHISTSIQADELVSRVSGETQDVIKRLLPEEEETTATKPEPPDSADALVVHSDVEGYVCAIDFKELVSLASDLEAKMVVACSTGDFIPAGGALLQIHGLDEETEPSEVRLKFCFVVGSRRTISQDLEYGLSQLVEIALRALSPGINDPFTAVACIHRLAACLRLIAERPDPAPVLFDDQDAPRVWRMVPDFGQLLDAAYAQIREAAAPHGTVLAELAGSLGMISEVCPSDERQAAVDQQIERIIATAEAANLPAQQIEALERIRENPNGNGSCEGAT